MGTFDMREPIKEKVRKKGRPGGRPKKIGSPEKLREMVDEYFDKTPKKDWGLTDMALALGFTDLKTFRDYKNYEGYEEIVKWAWLKVESAYEMDLKHF